jgi:hypothetical protein
MEGGLYAGAAQRVITPEVGTPLVGWLNRAAGDSTSRSVRDDLFVRALVLEQGGRSCALVTADLVGVDALIVERIRKGAAAATGIAADAILVSATH